MRYAQICPALVAHDLSGFYRLEHPSHSALSVRGGQLSTRASEPSEEASTALSLSCPAIRHRLPFCHPLALDLQHGLQGYDLSGSSSLCVTFCSHGGESIPQVRKINSEGISCCCK